MMTRMGKKMKVLRCRLQTANVGRDTFKGEGGTVKSTYTGTGTGTSTGALETGDQWELEVKNLPGE